jgi:uncharacterized protein YybS (DUF2232 family)
VSTFSTPAVSEAGKATALTVVVALVVAYLPLGAPLVLLLLPLPLAYLTSRRGVRVCVAAMVSAGVLASILTGPGNGTLTLFLGGFVGVTLGWALRRDLSFASALLATTLAAAVALVLTGAVGWVVSGMSIAQFQNLLDQAMKTAGDVYRGAGVSDQTITQATDQLRRTIDQLPYLLPALFGLSGLATAGISLGLAAVIFPRMGQPLGANMAFSRFRLHWSLAYGFIVGLGLLLVARFFPDPRLVRMIGLNLLLFFGGLFFVQGLAVTHWFAVTRKIEGGTRTLLYLAAVLMQVALQLTTWAGLFDTWFDYRTRFAPRGPGPESTVPLNPPSNTENKE